MDVIRDPMAPVLLIKDILDAETCRALIAYWQAGQKFEGPVSTAAAARQTDATAKIREDVMVGVSPLLTVLKRATVDRVIPAVSDAFGFRITQFESFRIGCYDAARGGFFRAHRDNTSPFTKHRQYALTLNLNTGDYAGGELRFPEVPGAPVYAPATGSGVVFACSLLHEVLPVTAGRRFGLFGFFYDDEGAKLVESYKEAGRVKGG